MASRFEHDVRLVAEEVVTMLVAKNKAYGDSATNPVRIFSRASAVEQLLVRIDDKLSRLARGSATDDEDVVKDLIGYLIILRAAQKQASMVQSEMDVWEGDEQ